MFWNSISTCWEKSFYPEAWEGRSALTKGEKPWKTISPSPIPFQETWHVPDEIKLSDIERVKKKFITASLTAVEIGFDLIEIHGTHGTCFISFYLQFQINVKINMGEV